MHEATFLASYNLDLGSVDLYEVDGKICILEEDLCYLLGYSAGSGVRGILGNNNRMDELIPGIIPAKNMRRRSFVTVEGALEACKGSKRGKGHPLGFWFRDFINSRQNHLGPMPMNMMSVRVRRLEERVGELEDVLAKEVDVKPLPSKPGAFRRFSNAILGIG